MKHNMLPHSENDYNNDDNDIKSITSASSSSTMTETTPKTPVAFEDLVEHDAIRYTLSVFQIGGITVSLLGNGLLIAYFLLNGQRRRCHANAAAWLIVNLAISDIAKSILHQPLRLSEILAPSDVGSFREKKEFCQTSGFIVLFLGGVGFHTIVAISQERLLLVCYPLTARRWLTRSNACKVLVAIWLAAFATAIPFPLLFSYRASVRLRNQTYRFCTIDMYRPDRASARYYFVFLFTAYYALPVAIVTVSYVRVFRSLNSGTGTGSDDVARDASTLRMIEHRKSLAKMMVAVAVGFAVFEGPLFLTHLYVSLGFRFYRNIIFLKMVIEILTMFTAVINPLVYCVRVKTFRRHLVGGGGSSAEAGTTNRRRGVIEEENKNADTHQLRSLVKLRAVSAGSLFHAAHGGGAGALAKDEGSVLAATVLTNPLVVEIRTNIRGDRCSSTPPIQV